MKIWFSILVSNIFRAATRVLRNTGGKSGPIWIWPWSGPSPEFRTSLQALHLYFFNFWVQLTVGDELIAIASSELARACYISNPGCRWQRVALIARSAWRVLRLWSRPRAPSETRSAGRKLGQRSEEYKTSDFAGSEWSLTIFRLWDNYGQ